MKTVLSEAESKALLRSVSVRSPPRREVSSPSGAVRAAAALGFPVVLKVSHPAIAHKSDVGGVVCDVRTEAQVRAECERLLGLCEGAKVLVEAQAARGGVDLICGLQRDPVFGPVVLVGFGGIYAEILRDTSLHVGPCDRPAAEKTLERLRGFELLRGARGTEPVALGAVQDVLVALSRLAQERPDVMEVDINPLRVTSDGAVALDALVVVGPVGGEVAEASPYEPERVRPLFAPASVAVVGASRTARRAGNIIVGNLRTLGFAGAVYPVNPAGGEIEGLRAYPSVADCPHPLELAVLAVPYQQVMPVMGDVVRAGVKHVIVVSGGFSDAGAEGKAREEELRVLCRAHGIALMGPNSIGTLDTRSGFGTSIGRLPEVPRSGISVFGQSGTLSTGFALEESTARGLGFAKIACMGNKADVDESDFLRYLADDEDTRCIGLYLEAASNGPRFSQIARYAAELKPVLVLKSGRTALGAAAAASHTGALAGADAVYDAVFRQAGVGRVDTFDELFGTLRAFDLCPAPRPTGRIGVVSITGVGCVLAADACGACELPVASITAETRARLGSLCPEWAAIGNPADIWSTIEQRGPAAAYREIGRTLIVDPNVDLLLLIGVLLEEGAFDAAAVARDIRELAPDKPVLACHLGGREDLLQSYQRGLEAAGIPVFRGPAEAIRAASFLVSRARRQDRRPAPPGRSGAPRTDPSRAVKQ